MLLENQIREMINSRYGSLTAFCKKIDVPNTTIDSILKRGIGKANVLNVIKMCNELGLSVDSLKHGILEPVNSDELATSDSLTSKELADQIKLLLSKTTDMNEQQKQHFISTVNFICNNETK